MIEHMKAELISVFLIVNIRSNNFYLGLKVEQDQEQKIMKLFQLTYIHKVLAKFKLDKSYSVNTPMKKYILF